MRCPYCFRDSAEMPEHVSQIVYEDDVIGQAAFCTECGKASLMREDSLLRLHDVIPAEKWVEIEVNNVYYRWVEGLEVRVEGLPPYPSPIMKDPKD